MARLLRNEPPVLESPDRLLDWIYVSDVAEGLIAAMAAPGLDGRVIDIGSGELTAIRDLVERLRSRLGHVPEEGLRRVVASMQQTADT